MLHDVIYGALQQEQRPRVFVVELTDKDVDDKYGAYIRDLVSFNCKHTLHNNAYASNLTLKWQMNLCANESFQMRCELC
jgi:hypothetical protein